MEDSLISTRSQGIAQSNSDVRRAYWTQQMDQAWDFMAAMRQYPVQECGEKPVSLTEATESTALEVQFNATKFAEHFERLFYLRQGQIRDFVAAAREMNERGWILRVE